MLKKATGQISFKEQYEKLTQRLKTNVEDVEKLMKATNIPVFGDQTDQDVTKNLL